MRLIVDGERSFEERDAFAALDEIANVARAEGLGALSDDELELLSALGSGEMRDAAHVRLDRSLPYVEGRRARRENSACGGQVPWFARGRHPIVNRRDSVA